MCGASAVLVAGAVLFLVAAPIAGCRKGISERIESNLAAEGGTRLDLGRIGVPDWDRVCILGPYTNNIEAMAVLGFEWDVEGKSEIRSSDGINVLAFVKDSSVVDFAEHPRGRGDFAELRGQCVDRDHAVLLAVRRNADGWMSFVQPHDDQTGPHREPTSESALSGTVRTSSWLLPGSSPQGPGHTRSRAQCPRK